ncbi:MAG: hypothetical protein NCW75_04435 [Phycisphaera sp.]|nr:MAG: hypothetical protein NCW75_04435 [Phycisphaera sp.]
METLLAPVRRELPSRGRVVAVAFAAGTVFSAPIVFDYERAHADEPITTTVVVTVGLGVVAGLIANWIYDSLTGEPDTKVCTTTKYKQYFRNGRLKSEWEQTKYTQSPAEIVYPDEFPGLESSLEPSYEISDRTFMDSTPTGETIVMYTDSLHHADVSHPDIEDYVRYEMDRVTQWRLLRPPGVLDPSSQAGMFDVGDVMLGTTDTAGTTGFSHYELSLEIAELGMVLESYAMVRQGEMPMVSGDIPEAMFAMAPGELTLAGVGMPLDMPIPDGIDTLNYTLRYRSIGSGIDLASPSRTSLSHAAEPGTIETGVGLACVSDDPPPSTFDTSAWVSFDLPDDFVVTDISIGVDEAESPTGEQTIAVRLYRDTDGGDPVGPDLELLDFTMVPIPDMSLTLLSVPANAEMLAGETLVVEVASRDQVERFPGVLSRFFLGANELGNDGTSYISAEDCGVSDPTDVVDLGFSPELAWAIQVNGIGVAVPCRADIDGDGALTLFDFLAFQNLFDAGDLGADFDGDGVLTLFDFLAFQNEFDAGCP